MLTGQGRLCDHGSLRGQPSVAVCAIKATADSFHYLAVGCASRGLVSCCQLFRARALL